jgi:pimeloyl-ACP methyl ester carboxylesterase
MATRRPSGPPAASPTPSLVRRAAHALPAAPRAADTHALHASMRQTSGRIQQLHQAFAGAPFDTLSHIPGFAVPTRMVQGVHDALTELLYSSIRHGGQAVLSMAGVTELARAVPDAAPGGPTVQAPHDAAGLAIEMGLYRHDGRRLDPRNATDDLGDLAERLCVFVHGLGCDEQSWSRHEAAWADSPWAASLPGAMPIDYGGLLDLEFHASAVYVRYNSTLAVDQNARQLAAQLQALSRRLGPGRQWLLVGHSMGGLVARRAHEWAMEQGLGWAQRTSMLVCLGTPDQGADLALLDEVVGAVPRGVPATRTRGPRAQARGRELAAVRRRPVALVHTPSKLAVRLLYGTLGDEGAHTSTAWWGQMLGDGLVRAGRAHGAGSRGDIEQVELQGLGHMKLLNHPRVYAVLRAWLGGPVA